MSLQLDLILACGVLALLYGAVDHPLRAGLSAGNARMQEIAAAIQEGARAYLNRQYTTIAMVGVVIFVLAFVLLRLAGGRGLPDRRHAFGRGRLCRHVRFGARQCAHRRSLASGPGAGPVGRVPLRRRHRHAGGGPGPSGRSPAITPSSPPAWVLTWPTPAQSRIIVDSLVGLGFGASLISIFARLGGGIFTKGADVGGDMVGKVEAGIPEDDPRNPATIADNVGDNVGDCAGMAADLFETFAVTTVATMVLASIYFTGDAASRS